MSAYEFTGIVNGIIFLIAGFWYLKNGLRCSISYLKIFKLITSMDLFLVSIIYILNATGFPIIPEMVRYNTTLLGVIFVGNAWIGRLMDGKRIK